jgi:hypothetical protein
VLLELFHEPPDLTICTLHKFLSSFTLELEFTVQRRATSMGRSHCRQWGGEIVAGQERETMIDREFLNRIRMGTILS